MFRFVEFWNLNPALVLGILTAGYFKYARVLSEESAPWRKECTKEHYLKGRRKKLKHKIGQARKNIIKKSSEAVYLD